MNCSTSPPLFPTRTKSQLGKLRKKVPEGNRVAIITNAGGPGIVATDMTISSGLELARFHPGDRGGAGQPPAPTANLQQPGGRDR